MTGHNECVAAVYKVVQPAAWKISVILIPKICSFWVLAGFYYNWRWLTVEGSRWLSQKSYFLSLLMCVLGTQAAPSTGWMPWCLEATGSISTPSASHWLGMDKGIYTSSGGLVVLLKLSDNGKRALCVVFKILEKNSHQTFLLLWSVSGGKEKRKRKKIPKTNKICLTLGMAKLHTWACFT